MPWVTDEAGLRKKVACSPCIRGHRSSKCDHTDRVLIEVRKPGRPLSSCPHPAGSCTCAGRVVINYTIPKSSQCGCPSTRKTTSASPAAGPASRIQKPKHKKSTSTRDPAALERALATKADEETETSDVKAKTETSSPPSSNANSPTSEETSPPSSSVARAGSRDSGVQLEELVLKTLSRDSRGQQTYAAVLAKSTSGQNDNTQQNAATQKSCCAGKKSEVQQPQPSKASCCSGQQQKAHVTGAPVPSQIAGHVHGPSQPMMLPPSHYNTGNPQAAATNRQYVVSNQGYPMGFSVPIPGPSYGAPMTFGYDPIMLGIPHHSHQHIHMPSTDGSASAPDHNCQCGDNCACLGCAAHPQNETTLNYIMSAAEVMMGYPPTPGAHNFNMQSTQQPVPFMIPPSSAGVYSPPGTGMMAFNNQAYPLIYPQVPGTILHSNGQWTPASSACTIPGQLAALPATEMGRLHFPQNADSGNETNSYMPSQDVHTPTKASGFEFDQHGGEEQQTPTLSPSSFLLQQYVLPGCSDESGACRCGDDCTCVGCLTHSGCNGVSLDDAGAGQNDLNSGFDPASPQADVQYSMPTTAGSQEMSQLTPPVMASGLNFPLPATTSSNQYYVDAYAGGG